MKGGTSRKGEEAREEKTSSKTSELGTENGYSAGSAPIDWQHTSTVYAN